MNKNKKAIVFRVGVFIFSGIVCLFAYIIFLGENRTFFRLVSKYKVTLDTADGLFAGSVVTINGVPAGNVTNIHFIEETGNIEVGLTVLRKYSPVITDRSKVSLITKGLLGDKYILITTSGKEGTKLPSGSYINTEKESGILGMFKNQEVKGKISNILDELLQLLHALNKENGVLYSIHEMADEIKKSTRTLNSTAKDISKMLSEEKSKELEQLLKTLNSIAQKLDEGDGTAGALINNKKLYYRVLGLLGERPYHQYLPSLVKEKSKK